MENDKKVTRSVHGIFSLGPPDDRTEHREDRRDEAIASRSVEFLHSQRGADVK